MNKKYIRNLLLSLDQTANTIFAGNPDSTISARTGYFAATPPESKFWSWQEKVINYAFKPIDGPNHCRQAWSADALEEFYVAGPIAKTFMTLLVPPTCVAIGLLIRGYVFVDMMIS